MSSKGSPIRRLQLFQREAATPATPKIPPIQQTNLNSQIYAKNLELQEIYQQNKLLKLRYEDQLLAYEKTIDMMEKQLKESEKCRQEQFNIIKERYDKMAIQQSQSMKNYHEHQIQFLLKQIAHLRTESTIKQQQLTLKQSQLENMKESYQREIQEKITEINTLHKKYLTFEENTTREIKQLNNKRQLERSRTSGLVSSRKQNNQFMDKQLRKLNEEVLDKSIKIESLSRELNKIRKKFQDAEKNYERKFGEMVAEREQEAAERQAHFTRIENSLKQQILEHKTKQLKLMGDIDNQQVQIEKLTNQISQLKTICQDKQEEIKKFKEILQQQRNQHANQISRLIKQRRKRSSQLGSSRSLGSSMKDSQEFNNAAETGGSPQPKNSVRLPTVKQQTPDRYHDKSIQNSQISVDQEQNELSRTIYHYDALIEELKRSHASELELLKHKINKITKILEEKQQQVLDILTRFSPLVKIHAEEKSVEQDRKQRIQRHWKADLGVLEILLKKYKIRTFLVK